MKTPNRIISLVPSLTELIADLGLTEQLIGRTRFCIHPEEIIGDIPIIGGTKNPDLEKIKALKPDLIIANKEENRKEDIESLSSEFEVLLTDINTIEDALLTIHDIGKRCGSEEKAKQLNTAIRKELNDVPDESEASVAYLIWRKPWMSIGSDTYIHSVLNHWNLKNVFSDKKRYPQIKLSDIAQRKPDFIFLSSEPYPFKEKHFDEIAEQCPDSRIILADGEWFSWYGSRMLPSFKKLNVFRKAIS